MKKVKVVLGFLVIVLLLGGWSPMPPAPGLMSGNSAAVAASGDPELVVNNLTGAAFYMTMTGPQTYSVHVLAGKNTFIVAKGVYALSYFACGAQQAKEVNVKKSGASIKLTCDSAGKSDTGAVQLTITNKTGASFYARLLPI